MDIAKEELGRQKEALELFSREQAEYVPAWKARVDAFEERQLELGADSVVKDEAELGDNPYAVKFKGTFDVEVTSECLRWCFRENGGAGQARVQPGGSCGRDARGAVLARRDSK